MKNQNINITSVIKEIQFPTNANGLLSVLVRVEPTPELEKFECGGVGFGIGTYIDTDNTLPFREGDTVRMQFDEKGELLNHVIGIKKKGFTKLPRKCVACGHDLRQIKTKELVEGLLCTNLMTCTAQSTSPIYRLAAIATDLGFHKDDLQSFINEFPEASLTHLSDLKIFLTSDPNTASREAMWVNRSAWKIEVSIWNYLQKEVVKCQDFWCIGFNITSNLGPRDVLQDSSNDSHPKIIKDNIDRISQLISFFDHWKKKQYVSENM